MCTPTRASPRTPSPTGSSRIRVAAAYGGTTTFLAFNNPGTGSSPAAERSLLAGMREWRDGHGARCGDRLRVSLAISGRMDDPIAELPAMVDAGVATAKAFMVFDFRLDERRHLRGDAGAG